MNKVIIGHQQQPLVSSEQHLNRQKDEKGYVGMAADLFSSILDLIITINFFPNEMS